MGNDLLVAGEFLTFATAIIGFISAHKRIGEVHSLVNNQLDRQLDRNAQLTASLTEAGVVVPPSPTAGPSQSGPPAPTA